MSPGTVVALVVIAAIAVLALVGVLRAALAGRARRPRGSGAGPVTARVVLDEIARPRRREDGGGDV